MVIANRGMDGSGVMNSRIKVFMDSRLRGNANPGRNKARLSTAGRSMANSVIQRFTCTEPKQLQDSAPVIAFVQCNHRKEGKTEQGGEPGGFFEQAE